MEREEDLSAVFGPMFAKTRFAERKEKPVHSPDLLCSEHQNPNADG